VATSLHVQWRQIHLQQPHEQHEPANITFQAHPAAGGANQAYSINPYYRLNGNCGQPPQLAGVLLDPTGTGVLGAKGESCRFNFAATVQDIPSSDRLNFVARVTQARRQRHGLGHDRPQPLHHECPIRAAGAALRHQLRTTRVPTLYNKYVSRSWTPSLEIAPCCSAPAGDVGYRGVGKAAGPTI
jgi:iron complex outermembrane receptor protein